jgi:hypothetical protein
MPRVARASAPRPQVPRSSKSRRASLGIPVATPAAQLSGQDLRGGRLRSVLGHAGTHTSWKATHDGGPNPHDLAT